MRPILAATTLAAFALTGCSDRENGGPGANEVGGTVVIAAPSAFTLSLPPLVQDAISRAVADLVYDRLTEIGPELNTFGDAEFTPRLARRWTWADDSLSISFELDPRARWHDGRPVRASDVRFSAELVKDRATASPAATYFGNLDSVTVRDSLTAVAWFRERALEQFYNVAYQLEIVPEHVLSSTPRDQLRAVDVERTFVGSGPFRMVRFEPGVRMEIVADTTHYRGRPRLDRVIWSVSSDAGAGITQFMSGQADLWESLPAELLPQVDSTPTVRAIPVPSLGYAYLAFNHRDPRRRGTPHPVLSDRQVRRALSMALDREAMLRNVFGDVGVMSVGPYPKALEDSGVTLLPFDRAAAAAMLDSSGWRVGAGGIRFNAGRPLAFSILTPTSSSQRMRYAVLIQEQLRSIGARVGIDAVDFRAFLDRQNGRNYDATLNLWTPDVGIGGIRETWTTSGMSSSGNNHMSYANPLVDALVDSALSTMRPALARGYLHRAHQLIVDDAPAVWLYDYAPLLGLHTRLRPEGMRPNGWWIGLPEWWIPEDERIDRDRVGLRPAPAQP